MKRILILSAASLLVFASCRKIQVDGIDNNTGGGTTITSESAILSGAIGSDLTLRSGKTYTLRGIVYVVNGAQLTIEPGVTILGDKNSRGTLVITRGSRINATGTASQPIVFTSSEGSGSRPGDWGGLVILGRARTNAAYNGTAGLGEAEGGINNGDGYGLYGGTDDNDNSGTLKYVRIEYAGYAFLPDKELNGLSLYAVGRGTTISYVEVAWAADDSFEWFGGTVNADHIIAYKGLDDDFDTDNGFSGKVQFAIGIRDSAVADISGSNGFESDNDAAGSTLTPQTSAIFANVTSVGPKAVLNTIGNTYYRNAAQIRRNSSLSVINSVLMGWNTGLLIDASTGRPTDLNITGTTPTLWWRGNIISGTIAANQVKYSASTNAATGWTTADALAWHNTTSFNNLLLATNNEVGYADAFNYNNPDFTVSTTSPLLTNSYAATDARFNGMTAVNYRGAVGPNDTWYKGWTRFGN
ncbi:hypothetical protein EPD60_03285 [Flaviaesturariibacter flavus]|uniref:T9SS C-terminal target domain-containing protein n=1 Tax=Flaviaesturariibacter flavus TaxID=2502780 RepID=A0A4R1BN73_9BACT|nr:hypothetical protein [Flaviaesturariibacter flavus]TCJ18797.1 hypothetical protein EPD60_03285 [Flaviaesturariibacter flavus]